MVFFGLYLIDGLDYLILCDVFDKLKFNDVVLVYELEILVVLGFGFCVGFFGLLYLEIICECFECEFDFDFILILFSVVYEVMMEDGLCIMVINFLEYLVGKIVEVCELVVWVMILVLSDYVGVIMELC